MGRPAKTIWAKPRSNAILKTLPPARQAQIAAYGLAHSLKDTVAWLAQDGIECSDTALSAFLLWHRAVSSSEMIEDMIKTAMPSMSAQRVREYAESIFLVRAVEQQDSKLVLEWSRHLHQKKAHEDSVRLREDKIKLEKSQFKLAQKKFKEDVKRHMATLHTEAKKGGITAETIERIQKELKL